MVAWFEGEVEVVAAEVEAAAVVEAAEWDGDGRDCPDARRKAPVPPGEPNSKEALGTRVRLLPSSISEGVARPRDLRRRFCFSASTTSCTSTSSVCDAISRVAGARPGCLTA